MRVVEVLEDEFDNLDELTVAILCGKETTAAMAGDARQLLRKGCYPFVFLFALN
jgi:hypothetical protein